MSGGLRGWFGKKYYRTYSNADMQFSPAALHKFASDWALTTRFILRYQKQAPDQFHLIRYEELKSDPGKVIKGVLNFLAVASGEENINAILEETDFKKLKGDDKEGFFRKGTTGDWVNYFTEEDKKLFKSRSGDLLVDLGYESDNNW